MRHQEEALFLVNTVDDVQFLNFLQDRLEAAGKVLEESHSFKTMSSFALLDSSG